MALLVDNARAHSNLYDIREQVVVIPLPPNVTSLHQPMDMIVISTWKQTYRRFSGQELVRDKESRAEILLSCDGRTSACHRIPPVAAGEDDRKRKPRRQGRQSRTPHFLHSVK